MVRRLPVLVGAAGGLLLVAFAAFCLFESPRGRRTALQSGSPGDFQILHAPGLGVDRAIDRRDSTAEWSALDLLRSTLRCRLRSGIRASSQGFPYTPILSMLRDDEEVAGLLEKVFEQHVGTSMKSRAVLSPRCGNF